MTQIMLYLNAIICGLISLRLLSFRRGNLHHRPKMSLLAWLIIITAGTVSIRILTGYYRTIDPAEVVLNSIIGVAIWMANGNISNLFNTRTNDNSL